MEGMDGAALAAAIRAEPSFSGAVAIVLAPMSRWSEVRRMQGCGIDACLMKPVRQSQLLNTLVSAWSKKQGGALAPETRAPREAAAMKSKLADRFAGAPMRVLVAEDNVVNQKVAVLMLKRLGVHAEVAGNGREAVEMCAARPYDVIFMDCQMPEMDGYAATAEIRKQQGSDRRTVIVAMTADAMEGCRERCIAAGMDTYVSKPVRLDDLIEALQTWAPHPVPAGPR
jgi:CheY-like chemotaxis protein